MERGLGRPNGGRKFTREALERVVPDCLSYAEVCRRLSARPVGSTLTLIRLRCEEYGLDTGHMVGQAHGRGVWNRRTTDEILVGGRRSREHPSRLRRAMLESGLPYACAVCGNAGEWRGEPLGLDIDHLDGDERNNLRENLRFLCPNCHRQTETWGRT